MKPQPLHPATRMAIQGALAVAFTLAINRLLGLERPYWGGLMAVVVIAGAWGENLDKLKQLLAGTAAAVAVSMTVLYLAEGRPLIVMAVSLFSLFMWAYHTPTSYAAATAWMGSFAIITISFAAGHRHGIALLRGLQVLIGGSLGVLVSAFVLPVGVGDALDRRLAALEKFLREAARKCFAEPAVETRATTIEIYRALAKVIATGRTAANQYLIFPARRKEIAARIIRLRRLAFHTNGLLESLAACREKEPTPGLEGFFSAAAVLVDRSFAVCLGEEGAGGSFEGDFGALRGLLAGEVGSRAGEFPRRALAPYLMFIYHVRGIVETAAAVPPGLAAHPGGHTGGILPSSPSDPSPPPPPHRLPSPPGSDTLKSNLPDDPELTLFSPAAGKQH